MEKGKATQKSIREHNIGMILKKIRDERYISRIKISKTTKLAKSTISDLTNFLIEKGLIVESNKAESKLGKKPTLLKFNNDSFFILALDVGQDNLIVVLANSIGSVINRVELLNYPKKNKEQILNSIDTVVSKVLSNSKNLKSKIKVFSVGTHGVVDPKTNIITNAPYLNNWSGVNLVAILGNKYKKHIVLNNSVNLGAIGEQWQNYQDIQNLIYINIDHGIGAGIIINNQAIIGYNGTMGEIAYLPILIKGGYEGLKDNKFELGIFEKQLDIKGITNTVKNALQKNSIQNLNKNIKSDKINFASICSYYNDPVDNIIKKIIDDEVIKVLAIGLSSIISIIDTELIIINGEILDFGEEFFKKLERDVNEITPFKRNIVLSDLKKDAHIFGAIKSGIDYLNDLLYNSFFSLVE